ncbi:MAG: hypothetical protein WA709_13760 [Stellaceae bacterium]
MNRLTMLVSAEGTWMFEDSAEFRAALGDQEPDYDGAAFAVKNLGFLKFQILDNSIIEIDLHPHNVEIPALLAVQQQLLNSQIKLFRLKYFDVSWKSEIICSAELAVARLSELCAPRFALSAADRFLVEPQDYLRLFESEQGPLQLMAQKWRMSFGHFDPSVISFAIKKDLLSRLIIVGVKPPGTEPVFRFIGDGHNNWLDDNYHLRAIGEKVQDQPDKNYGQWVSQFYKSVASTGQPRYDYVTAAIQRPPGTYTTRYERLLLPWKTPSDEVLVTLSSRGLRDDVVEKRSVIEPENSLARYSAMSS